MGGITIDSGAVRIEVNGDPSRVISFNPEDVGFAERFYSLLGEFAMPKNSFTGVVEACDGDAKAALIAVKEACLDMCSRIDGVFGEGTSKAAFGEEISPRMLTQFFEGITPYIAKAREAKMAVYKK